MADKEILVIDDDPIILMIHQVVLEFALPAVTCQYFSEAQKALSYMKDHVGTGKEFLLFLDINMPVLNGWDLLGEIEHSDFKENIYVVMVTSSVNEGDKIKAGSYSNIHSFISKPLKEEYIEKLREIEKIKAFLI